MRSGADWPEPPPARRFPPLWSAEESEACFIVRDANGQALAYVYFEEEPATSRRLSDCSKTSEGVRWR
jgi:hypothetical protein